MNAQTLTAAEVATMLARPRSWVYRHAHALGGFQPAFGAALTFSATRIREILEGKTHAIPDQGRQVESRQNDRRTQENAPVQNQGRGKSVGSRANPRNMARAGHTDPHGLLA